MGDEILDENTFKEDPSCVSMNILKYNELKISLLEKCGNIIESKNRN